ncbi:MAG: deaminase [Streptosporangiales bacterium]|nr:deaminase [Streptosporangiales bacterium]
MGLLKYTAIMSLDGYIEDEGGKFDWAVPDAEVHAYVNEQERPIGTFLYGRRMYEAMSGWETDQSLAEQGPLMREFAELWQAAEKVVYSSTLEKVSTARTRIERHFNPEAVRRMKEEAPSDLTVSGPELAFHAFKSGLVDECDLYLTPIVVGGGKSALPSQVRVPLELLGERRFRNGMVHLHYRVIP